VAQQGGVLAAEDGRTALPPPPQGRVADCVYAAVDLVESTIGRGSRNRVLRIAEVGELLGRDDTVLTSGQV
jgi:hypothetical protein